jgi:cell division protein FtsB
VLARLLTFVPTAVLAVLIGYFAFHALTGDRGLLTARARELRAQRIDLQRDVHLLSDNNLSVDLLEERSHVLLGFADPRDYVIRTPSQPR